MRERKYDMPNGTSSAKVSYQINYKKVKHWWAMKNRD